MAIVIARKTKCSICGAAISLPSDVVAFPDFVPHGHVFAAYSDSAFHRECFAQWTHGEEFQQLYDSYKQCWDSRPPGLSLDEMEAWGRIFFANLFEPGMHVDALCNVERFNG